MKNYGKAGPNEKGLQSVQGMSRRHPVILGSPSKPAVQKMGIKAKGTVTMPKSKKKKVIVNALLNHLMKGSSHKM